jgi:hypothetical protein
MHTLHTVKADRTSRGETLHILYFNTRWRYILKGRMSGIKWTGDSPKNTLKTGIKENNN